MTIKNKLRINMIVSIAGLALIAGFSFVGMEFVQRNLFTLTERSTPYQLKTIDSQRALQEHTSNLMKLSTSVSTSDLIASKSDIANSISEVKRTLGELAELKGEKNSGSVKVADLTKITDELIVITESRLEAEEAVTSAGNAMLIKVNEISRGLTELDSSIKKLQQSSVDQLQISSEKSKKINQRLNLINEINGHIKSIQSAVLEIYAANKKKEINVAKNHFISAMRYTANSVKRLDEIDRLNTLSKPLTDGMSDLNKIILGNEGLIIMKEAYILKPEDKKINEECLLRMTHAKQEISNMTVLVQDEVEKSSDKFAVESKNLEEALNMSNKAGVILSLNSELMSLGYEINGLIERLFRSRTSKDLENIISAIKGKFDNASEVGKKLIKELSDLKKTKEMTLVKNVSGSLDTIKGLIFSGGGVAEKLRHMLKVQQQALGLNINLREIVTTQREEGKKSVTTAQEEQEKTVKSVNMMVNTFTTGVGVVGFVILIVSVIFNKQIHRSILSPISELMRIAKGFGEGDFNNKMDESRNDEFGKVASDFNRASEKLMQIISELSAIINHLVVNSSVLQSTADTIAKGANDQSMQIEQATIAMMEMMRAIGDVAKNSSNTLKMSNDTSELAKQGKEAVDSTVNEMQSIFNAVKKASTLSKSLGECSRDIGKVVDVINEVAEQINLLALNAAIEAARAGEHGRSFAVVADEIKKLSDKTVGSTQEIIGIINKIQSSVSESIKAMKQGEFEVASGMKLADEAKTSLDMIVSASQKGAGMIHTIAVASEQQSAVSANMSKSMETILLITTTLHSTISDIKNISDMLNQNAEKLGAMASWFKKTSSC